MSASVPWPGTDPEMMATSVMAGVLWRHRLVVTPSELDYCASQIGEACGWTHERR
jgi:hypothetical protein